LATPVLLRAGGPEIFIFSTSVNPGAVEMSGSFVKVKVPKKSAPLVRRHRLTTAGQTFRTGRPRSRPLLSLSSGPPDRPSLQDLRSEMCLPAPPPFLEQQWRSRSEVHHHEVGWLCRTETSRTGTKLFAPALGETLGTGCKSLKYNGVELGGLA